MNTLLDPYAHGLQPANEFEAPPEEGITLPDEPTVEDDDGSMDALCAYLATILPPGLFELDASDEMIASLYPAK